MLFAQGTETLPENSSDVLGGACCHGTESSTRGAVGCYSPRTGNFVCRTEARSAGGAIRAQEQITFRTVVTTGASALRIQIPATASSWLGGHYSHRLPPPKPGPHCSPKLRDALQRAGSLRRLRARREVPP